MKNNFGKWQIGNISSTVISDIPFKNKYLQDSEDIHYYGGHLVCESIGNIHNARLIAAAPILLEALQAVYDTFTFKKYNDTLSVEDKEVMVKVEKALFKATYQQ